MVVQLENCLSFEQCIVHNLHILIYNPFIKAKKYGVNMLMLWMPLLRMSMMHLGTISVDAIGVDTNL